MPPPQHCSSVWERLGVAEEVSGEEALGGRGQGVAVNGTIGLSGANEETCSKNQSWGQVTSFTFDPGQILVNANVMLGCTVHQGEMLKHQGERVKTPCLSSWMLLRAIRAVKIRNIEYWAVQGPNHRDKYQEIQVEDGNSSAGNNSKSLCCLSSHGINKTDVYCTDLNKSHTTLGSSKH